MLFYNRQNYTGMNFSFTGDLLFIGCELKGCTFEHCTGAIFINCIVTDCDFEGLDGNSVVISDKSSIIRPLNLNKGIVKEMTQDPALISTVPRIRVERC